MATTAIIGAFNASSREDSAEPRQSSSIPKMTANKVVPLTKTPKDDHSFALF